MNKNPYQPRLTFVGDHFTGRVYELTQEKIIVGRGADNTLVIHHPSVSLVHCEILVNDAEVIVRDLGSTNGCFVDGIRLSHQQSQLKSGQLVRLGAVTARLELKNHHDEATEMTAVHEHRRIVRDQARERKESKPQPSGMTLDDGSNSGDAEKTLTFAQTQPARDNKDHFATAPTVATPGKPSATTATKIAAVLAVGLVTLLLVWLVKR